MPDQRRAIVQEAVAIAVEDDQASAFHEFTSTAERSRLEDLILEWLSIEDKRATNFVVEHLEEERYLRVPGLELKLRVDRIDRLSDGSIVLIDYKSGEQKRKNLEGERPAEPQLLVYATAVDERVDGVFFAQLKPRDLRGVGYYGRKHFRDRTASVPDEGWDEFIAESRIHIRQIAEDLVAGVAEVDPIKSACEYCRQRPLCRVSERMANPGDDSDE